MNEELEGKVRQSCEEGDLDAATTAALEGYGPEVLGFLVVRMRDEHHAGDVFSQLSEDLWRGIAGFRWQCSLRTWMYTLARNAALRFERNPHNQSRRRVSLSRIGEVAERLRSQTLAHLRTEAKDGFQELRETLDPADQTLLILRVNRELSWNDVARVMADVREPSDAEIARLSTNLRQRFQKLKKRLREQARVAGLLHSNGG